MGNNSFKESSDDSIGLNVSDCSLRWQVLKVIFFKVTLNLSTIYYGFRDISIITSKNERIRGNNFYKESSGWLTVPKCSPWPLPKFFCLYIDGVMSIFYELFQVYYDNKCQGKRSKWPLWAFLNLVHLLVGHISTMVSMSLNERP